LSSSELKRSEALVTQGFLSPIRLDELRATRDRDAARVAEVQAQLATRATRHGPTRSRLPRPNSAPRKANSQRCAGARTRHAASLRGPVRCRT